MKRIKTKLIAWPYKDSLYYTSELVYPEWPEIHKDDVCRYYTQVNHTKYVVTYMCDKPIRWKKATYFNLWARRWNRKEKPLLFLTKDDVCIFKKDNADQKDLLHYLKFGLENQIMEDLL